MPEREQWTIQRAVPLAVAPTRTPRWQGVSLACYADERKQLAYRAAHRQQQRRPAASAVSVVEGPQPVHSERSHAQVRHRAHVHHTASGRGGLRVDCDLTASRSAAALLRGREARHLFCAPRPASSHVLVRLHQGRREPSRRLAGPQMACHGECRVEGSRKGFALRHPVVAQRWQRRHSSAQRLLARGLKRTQAGHQPADERREARGERGVEGHARREQPRARGACGGKGGGQVSRSVVRSVVRGMAVLAIRG